MECVILYRNIGNGSVGYVTDGDSDKMMVYRDEDAALRDVPNIPILRSYPYQIVELEH
jgi:hypothetical protein